MTSQPAVEPMAPDPEDDGVLRIQTGDTHEPVVAQRFTLDDDDQVLTAIRPKMWMMSQLGQALYGARISGHSLEDDPETGLAALRAVDLFVTHVLDPDSADYLTARMNDPDDTLDLEHVLNAMIQLVGIWTPERPTTPPRASSQPSRSTGRRSTVRRR